MLVTANEYKGAVIAKLATGDAFRAEKKDGSAISDNTFPIQVLNEITSIPEAIRAEQGNRPYRLKVAERSYDVFVKETEKGYSLNMWPLEDKEGNPLAKDDKGNVVRDFKNDAHLSVVQSVDADGKTKYSVFANNGFDKEALTKDAKIVERSIGNTGTVKTFDAQLSFIAKKDGVIAAEVAKGNDTIAINGKGEVTQAYKRADKFGTTEVEEKKTPVEAEVKEKAPEASGPSMA